MSYLFCICTQVVCLLFLLRKENSSSKTLPPGLSIKSSPCNNSFFMHCSPLMIKKTRKFSFAALAIILISSATSYFAPQTPPPPQKKKKKKTKKKKKKEKKKKRNLLLWSPSRSSPFCCKTKRGVSLYIFPENVLS